MAIATRRGRNYITPEDIRVALWTHGIDRVRRDVLAALGGAVDGMGAEDWTLCAWIAYRGRR